METKELDAQIVEVLGTVAKGLITRLDKKAARVHDKYEYYNADNDVRNFGISVPKKMMNSRPGVGWAGRAVNTLSDRLNFDGFANDQVSINETFDTINGKLIINKAKHDAIIAGCAFVAVSDDEDGNKMLVPFTAEEATGVIDQNTGLLSMGLAVTRWSVPTDKRRRQVAEPVDYILFMPEFTAIFEDKLLCDIKENVTKRCLMQPITRRQSADMPLGKSKISNTVRRVVQEVARLKQRYEIAAEFYSTPQRYINGLAQGAEKDTNLDSALGKIWAINKDEDGEKPDIGQLAQMSISQFSEQKKDLARDFCAETGLTLRNLGYETGNPTSAESLSAMSDDLLLEAQNCQKEMGEQIKQIAITLYMATHNIDTVPAQLNNLLPAWSPIFQINIGAAGDAMYKLFEIMPELRGTVTAYQMLGIGVREAERLKEIRTSTQTNNFMGGA